MPRVVLSAEYPPNWPAVLRQEQAAAYLGFRDTAELSRAVVKGEAPRPHDRHGHSPVWYRQVCDDWLSDRLGGGAADERGSSLKDLI